MRKLSKFILIAIFFVVAFMALMVSKWYYTAAKEPIDPKRGVYGMDGLEIWIDLNIRMPAAARKWGCETLLSREAEVMGGPRDPQLAPYGCQPGFEDRVLSTAYDTAVNANLAQAGAGMDQTKLAALRACFDTKMAASVTPEDIAAMNDFVQGEQMQKVIIAVNQNARACKAELAP